MDPRQQQQQQARAFCTCRQLKQVHSRKNVALSETTASALVRSAAHWSPKPSFDFCIQHRYSPLHRNGSSIDSRQLIRRLTTSRRYLARNQSRIGCVSWCLVPITGNLAPAACWGRQGLGLDADWCWTCTRDMDTRDMDTRDMPSC